MQYDPLNGMAWNSKPDFILLLPNKNTKPDAVREDGFLNKKAFQ